MWRMTGFKTGKPLERLRFLSATRALRSMLQGVFRFRWGECFSQQTFFLVRPVEKKQAISLPVSVTMHARFEQHFAVGLSGQEVGRSSTVSAAST